MKSLLLIVLAFLTGVLSGCRDSKKAREHEKYENGTYRGVFIDRDTVQVGVEFMLENGVVTRASFRHLCYGKYRLGNGEEPYQSVIRQHQEILAYLVGKNLEKTLKDLYHPEPMVSTSVDGYSGATIRSGKIISAIRDGLNRGVYGY